MSQSQRLSLIFICVRASLENQQRLCESPRSDERLSTMLRLCAKRFYIIISCAAAIANVRRLRAIVSLLCAEMKNKTIKWAAGVKKSEPGEGSRRNLHCGRTIPLQNNLLMNLTIKSIHFHQRNWRLLTI